MSTQQSQRDELEFEDPLAVNKETIHDIDVPASEQADVKGGWRVPKISEFCPQRPPSETLR